MPDHLHALTDRARKPSDVLRFIKGMVSRRVIGYLKKSGYASSLEKLRIQAKERRHQYALWQHHSNVFLLTSESAEAYRWSSARCWAKRTKEDEPLLVDLDRITWRVLR